MTGQVAHSLGHPIWDHRLHWGLGGKEIGDLHSRRNTCGGGDGVPWTVDMVGADKSRQGSGGRKFRRPGLGNLPGGQETREAGEYC